MKHLPTYTEQFNKITEAYIRGEIELNNSSFCFCGTLSGGHNWKGIQYNSPYSTKEFIRMEVALFSCIDGSDFEAFNLDNNEFYITPPTKINEDELFSGMCAALEVLKQIHIERGQIIDDAPVFTKREPINHPITNL